jgi:hypothetical protein
MTNDNLDEAWKGYSRERLEKRYKTHTECENRGLHWARACVGTRTDGDVAQDMAEWIDEVEPRQSNEQTERSHRLTQRGVEAAEQSAASADKSADYSGTSARAALASTFISLLALVVAVAAYLKT